LGNSASYGLHLLANGFPWKPGDEVVLVRGDFPSVTLPWLALERRGVGVRFIEPGDEGLQSEDLVSFLTERTKVFCTTWVHSFTGRAIDLEAVGESCRSRGVRFVLNGAQAFGTRPIDLSSSKVDAVTGVGFKWLCGPYGTGFCWMKPELREALIYNQAYWLAMQTADDLGKVDHQLGATTDLGARRYDVFGTANFFNFKPLTASVEYLTGKGIARIAEHNANLVTRLIDGLDGRKFRVSSPRSGVSRSTLVLMSHHDPNRNESIYHGLLERGIYAAFRKGNLRFSPHLYNTEEDVDAALSLLNEA
jgi:selenocysteine lyase/cysteine desulfurase